MEILGYDIPRNQRFFSCPFILYFLKKFVFIFKGMWIYLFITFNISMLFLSLCLWDFSPFHVWPEVDPLNRTVMWFCQQIHLLKRRGGKVLFTYSFYLNTKIKGARDISNHSSIISCEVYLLDNFLFFGRNIKASFFKQLFKRGFLIGSLHI